MDAKKIFVGLSIIGVIAGLAVLVSKVFRSNSGQENRNAILEKAREAKAFKAAEKAMQDSGEVSNQD